MDTPSTIERKGIAEKKVGIMTLYFNYNYGALLQAYALRKTIEELGFNAEDIRYYREINGKSTYKVSNESAIGKLRVAINTILKNPKTCINYFDRINRKIKAKKNRISDRIFDRHKLFDEFIRDEIKESTGEYDGHKAIEKVASDYQIFVCGSDNIWNKNMFDTAFMLDFVPDEKLKIAYAPGMSTDSLNDSQIALIEPVINRIDYLSCREESGAKVLSEILNRDVFIALDPTLLRTDEQWETIEKKPSYNFDFSTEYIFCYFCGTNSNHRKQVTELAVKKNLPIVTLPDISGQYEPVDDGFGQCRIYKAGPREFLFLIRNATYVCTDSFHGSIFSVIFRKEFFSFYRFTDNSTGFLNTRIDNLYNSLGLPEERIVKLKDSDIVSLLENPIDYERVSNNLNKKRQQSIQYLQNALSDGDNRKTAGKDDEQN